MRTTEAYRLLETDVPGGEPYEVTIRQYGSRATAWHMRRVDHGKAAGELGPADRTALRAAMVERARQSFARAAGGVNPADTVDSLTFIIRTQGFLLDVAGRAHHGVKFPSGEWEEILREAAAQNAQRRSGR
jgi:hypothetical protein